MYKLLNEAVDTDKIDPWCQIIPEGFSIFGFSWVGDFFLSRNGASAFGVLLTHSAKFESVPASNLAEFENNFLGDSKIRASVLREADVKYLIGRLGRPGENEVFFPTPYPWLGGNGSLETYQKGDVWVYASIAGQSHGLGAA